MVLCTEKWISAEGERRGMKVQRVNFATGFDVTKGDRYCSSDQDADRKEDQANLGEFGVRRVVLVCRHELPDA